MKIRSKALSLSRTALLCAVFGVSTATQAQAFFVPDDRPPPNGANGLSLNGVSANGLSANGLSANGLSANGLSANGLSANGRISQSLTLQSVILSNGEEVELR